MISGGIQFPKDDFINNLRTSGKTDHIIKQVNKLNIQWIYETIKYVHNVLVDSKENPLTKLNALKVTKSFLQTCDFPPLTLIQVYLLPILFSVSSYKPQQTGERRGHRFFTQNGYSPRIPDIEETGIKFMGLSTQILYVGSLIKTRRTLQNDELNQESQFVESYNRLKGFGITGIPSISELKFFTESFAKTAPDKYLHKLKTFEQYSEQYSEFLVIKMIQSLQTEQNPLFSSTGKSVSSLSTDLDMRKLLKHGDTYITSPLIQQLNDGLQSSENFIVKKNFLSLLSDFVKWADVEAFVQVSYEDTIDQIAFRISEVNGSSGLNEGENIFPQVKGQKEAKKKFYIEFLKCIQVWSKCIITDLENDDEPSKIKELYEFFKVEKSFKFPENLMAKRIETDFIECKEYNKERNEKILQKLKLDETSLLNNKKSINSVSKAASLSKMKQYQAKQKTLQDLKKQLDRCFDYLNTLFDNEDYIEFKIKELLNIKQSLDKDLQNLADDPGEEEIIQVLDDGDILIEQVDIIYPLFCQFKEGKISFEEFAQKFNEELGEDEQHQQNEQQLKKSKSKLKSSRSKSKKSAKSREVAKSKESFEDRNDVITSFNPGFNHYNRGVDSQQRQTVRTSEQIMNALPIRYNDDKGSMKENFASQSSSGDGSIKNHYMKKEERIESEPNMNSYISENEYYQKSFSKKSSVKPSRLSNKISRLENKSVASSLKERISMKKSLKSSRNFFNKLQSDYSESARNSQFVEKFAKESHVSEFDEQKKQKIKSIIESRRQNRSNSRKSSKRVSKISYGGRQENVIKNSSVKSPSNSQKSSSINEYGITEKQENELCYAQTLQNPMYNKIPTNKSQKIIKFEKYKNSNLSEKRYENFVEKGSQKSSYHEKNQNSFISDESANLNMKNHYSVSQKLGDKDEVNEEVFVGEYLVRNADKEVVNEMKYSAMKKSKLSNPRGEKSEFASSIRKSNIYTNELRESKMNEKQESKYFSKISKGSRKLESKLQSKVEGEGKSSQYSHLASEYYENDVIKEPSLKPLQNSYYGVEQIEAKIKCTQRPLFKECFDVKKEVIPFEKNKMSWLPFNNEYDLFRKERRIPEKANRAEAEYILKKLRNNRRQSSKNLSNQTSKLSKRKSSALGTQKQFGSFSRSNQSDSSRECDFLSSNKSSKSSSSMNSLSKRGNSMGMRERNESSKGKKITMGIYERFFMNVNENEMKKPLLKSKSLLKKNGLIEIGALCKQDDGLKIKVYLTSMQEIEDVSYNFSQTNDFHLKAHPESFPFVDANKQIRISILLQLRRMPFIIPYMTISYVHQNEKVSESFNLPCYPHKFIEWRQIEKGKMGEEFWEKCAQLLKTEEFKINKKVLKVDKLGDYIPNLCTIKESGKNKVMGVEGEYRQERFVLKFTITHKTMQMEGSSKGSQQFLQYVMCSLFHLFSAAP